MQRLLQLDDPPTAVFTVNNLVVLAAGTRSPEIPGSARLLRMAGRELAARGAELLGRRAGARPEGGGAFRAGCCEGWAVQDVWILPVRDPRTGEIDRSRQAHGTTLRAWDADAQGLARHLDQPADGRARGPGGPMERQGRRAGRDVRPTGRRPVDLLRDHAGQLPLDGETLQADGHTWKLEGEFLAKRMD